MTHQGSRFGFLQESSPSKERVRRKFSSRVVTVGEDEMTSGYRSILTFTGSEVLRRCPRHARWTESPPKLFSWRCLLTSCGRDFSPPRVNVTDQVVQEASDRWRHEEHGLFAFLDRKATTLMLRRRRHNLQRGGCLLNTKCRRVRANRQYQALHHLPT
ncbi:uncharacterized protein [Dermacentor albipictus]|uniref:uncharacterized protein n=1 Tax=Dermacentor albipictus TaxID=60249 RepID=UPI0038FCBDE7